MPVYVMVVMLACNYVAMLAKAQAAPHHVRLCGVEQV